MLTLQRLTLPLILLLSHQCNAQPDTERPALLKISAKFIIQVDKNIERYCSRINSTTLKTLEKLSRWEQKIKKNLLKINPDAAAKLFGAYQTTFGEALIKARGGKSVFENITGQYDAHLDRLTTCVKYLEQEKMFLKNGLLKPVSAIHDKINALSIEVNHDEAVEKFIRERKKRLLDEAIRYTGKRRYLERINKEVFYYAEAMRNYKEIFSDKKKAEEMILHILDKIPGFQKFAQQNSLLAALFGNPDGFVPGQLPAGLQTRASIQNLVQSRIAVGGPNAQQQVLQYMQQARAQLNELKDRVLKAGGTHSDANIPDFKPNMQRTKTFLQRLEFGSNFQFDKTTRFIPATANIGLVIGYKLNDKSVIGLGTTYKMGLGAVQHISITNQELGVRSYLDWKLNKQLFITGGFEMNYHIQFKNTDELRNYNSWQKAALIGLSKKIKLKTRWPRGGKLQLLYDLYSRQHIPISQPVLFRTGFSLQ